MTKILGLDLGTNSLGWAITEHNEDCFVLLDKGVDIFQEGVAREKAAETPAVQKRTQSRALRRQYFRRRLRKIELLKVLIDHHLCPPLSDEQLKAWNSTKKYPLDDDFLAWQRTNDNADRNPYHDRHTALTAKLNLENEFDRYLLGRALYHLSQRRGFASNRKDETADADGKVKQGIADLDREMAESECEYLGEYFYKLHLSHSKIRGRYTSRNEHYRKEFDAICRKQELSDELTGALAKAIFFQRPLKSQKGSVGKCTFEKHKSRCPSSHPRYEEFRMLSFINNIRIRNPYDNDFRPLNDEEMETIKPLFFRKSKEQFDFEDIAKRLAGKGQTYGCRGDRNNAYAAYLFNYKMTVSVSGCPVTAQLIAIFGDDWLNEICSLYTLGEGKTQEQILNDVWHALFSFTDDDRLKQWAKEMLQLDDVQADKFVKIRLPQDYASLSLNAINKILPYLRVGYRYDEAVFAANLKAVLPAGVWNDDAHRQRVVDDICALLDDYARNPLNVRLTKEQVIADYLKEYEGVDATRLKRLYHPSMIETYRKAQPDAAGVLKLGSPRTSAVRNPMAMRALFRLRALVNKLLQEDKIDRETKINIEFSRGLNDSNRRKAIEHYQRDMANDKKKYADEITRLFSEETGRNIVPNDDDILKFKYWEEQNHICLYTGNRIRIEDFIGANPRYDFEHTVPRSRGGDNSQANKTLCQCSFNRQTKREKLPSELGNHAEVMARIESLGWEDKIESLERQIAIQLKNSKTATTKEAKDRAIEQRHYLKLQLEYWRSKLERFTMTEVPEGFSSRQGVDIGIIGRYARLYLATVFEHIYTVKGATTAQFRTDWGLQDEYTAKERVNHIHHCIDAITIACIDKGTYDKWAQYARDTERYELYYGERPHFEKPWPTFTEDVKAVGEELLVSHHTHDNMTKHGRKKMRVRGKIQLNKQGEIKYVQGDTARGVLHQETFYGAIKRDDEIKYVVRKQLDALKPEYVDKIVDEVVRSKVKEAVERYGFKEAVSGNVTIWMNEQKRIPIRKVRIFTPSVTEPINLKKQRDLSRFDYKQDYHVVNGSNYCMAIYEGHDAKGKTKRGFELVNNLDAARFYKHSSDKVAFDSLVPSDKDGLPLRAILKTGTMVLFYETSPEELYECTKAELVKRLYKVTGLSTLTVGANTYGRMTMKYHQEARAAGDIKAKNGAWKIGEEYRPVIGIYHTQLNAFIEGYDFELTVTGEIKLKH